MDAHSFTSSFGGEVGARASPNSPSEFGWGKGAFPGRGAGEGPLTRPKRVDLSPRGRGEVRPVFAADREQIQ